MSNAAHDDDDDGVGEKDPPGDLGTGSGRVGIISRAEGIVVLKILEHRKD